MESTTLRQFLQTICCNSPWNYAVFWKLQHQTQMLLTLEDGYCHTPKQTNSTESIVDNICFKGSDEIFSSKSGSKIYDGNMGTDPVKLAVAYMSSARYTLGDGVVGEVACSGNYHWVFSDDITPGEYSSKLVPKCHDDWIFQFAAGIKTLLLVPVIPHGVLQFGSLETVAEDLALVANVKDKFFAYLQFVGCCAPFSANMQFPAHSESSLMSTLVQNELSGLTMNVIKFEDSNDDNSVKQSYPMLSTRNQITPSNNGENLRNLYGKDVLKIPNVSTEKNICVQSMGLAKEPDGPEPLFQSFNCHTLEMMENSLFRFSCIEEELQTFSHPNSDNLGAFGEYAIQTMKSASDRGITAQSLVDKEASNFGTFFSFPRDCELHKALGPTIMGQTNKYLWETPVSGEDEYNCSSLVYNGDFNYNIEPTVWESRGPFNKEYDAKLLLGSVVADVNCSLDKNISDRAINIKSSTTSLEQLSTFSEEQSQSERRTSVVKDAAQQSCVTSAITDRGRNANTSYSPSASSFKSVMSALIREEHQKKGHRNTHTRKGSKLSSVVKRRASTRDNRKPRPRDRQLIQDRLKELRDLVPDGVKCSIDGLLDRTIQQMMFLRRVTDQADRLRKLVHQEVAGGKNLKSADRKGGQQNGTSWAIELGNEQQICPIIVEDLEYPGHMLIEMLCNGHGCFLEIAEVIRRLDLTILKGVMEKCSESTWARFIVEVPRGFHRLDIFWPLMQLLQ